MCLGGRLQFNPCLINPLPLFTPLREFFSCKIFKQMLKNSRGGLVAAEFSSYSPPWCNHGCSHYPHKCLILLTPAKFILSAIFLNERVKVLIQIQILVTFFFRHLAGWNNWKQWHSARKPFPSRSFGAVLWKLVLIWLNYEPLKTAHHTCLDIFK